MKINHIHKSFKDVEIGNIFCTAVWNEYYFDNDKPIFVYYLKINEIQVAGNEFIESNGIKPLVVCNAVNLGTNNIARFKDDDIVIALDSELVIS